MDANHSSRDREQLESSIAAGYERRDLSVRGIVVFGVILVLSLALIGVGVSVGLAAVTGRSPQVQSPPQGLANAPAPSPPPAPALEAEPGVAYDQFLAGEEVLLNSYGWVDQKNGIARIPIERAMDLLLERGLPTRPVTDTQFQDQGTTSPSVPSSGRMNERYP